MGGTESRVRATRAGYDRWAGTYDDADPSTQLDEPLVLAWLAPLDGVRVLDVGCGTGRYARRLIERGARLAGVDLSAGMLRRCVRETPAGKFVQARADRLPFFEASFERVASGLVLDHLETLDEFFAEIFRVLKPDGRAAVAAIHPEIQRLTGEAVQYEAGRDAIPGFVHEVSAMRNAARGAGFDVHGVLEPVITAAMLEQCPQWRERLGLRGCVVLQLRMP
jgi:malonyl-CoA O-methyltransferase